MPDWLTGMNTAHVYLNAKMSRGTRTPVPRLYRKVTTAVNKSRRYITASLPYLVGIIQIRLVSSPQIARGRCQKEQLVRDRVFVGMSRRPPDYKVPVS